MTDSLSASHWRDGDPAEADRDDRWAAAVESYDEALAAGTSMSGETDNSNSWGPDAPADVIKARTCLERLSRLLPGSVSRSPAASTDFGADELWPVDLDNNAANGRRIGRFEIRSELGRGGQGVVFLAWDPKLKREIALKVPRPELLLTRDTRRRFLREGQAAAGLNHPHIVTVLEAGEVGPVCFIAQEYCAGGTLSAWLKNNPPVNPRAAATFVLALTTAAEQAHARGILHRDLKPSNVLLTGDATCGLSSQCPKINDFGLAKVIEWAGDDTATGAVLGTAAYMPPEQAIGRSAQIGPASDVYGLGAILYELLTGRAPFAGASPVEILQRLAADEPARPRAIRRQVPRDLEAICLRCLEKDPQRRYATATLLADDLRRFLRGEPTVVRPTSAPERLIKWARRRPGIAALLTVACLSLVTLMATISFYTVSLRAALDESERSRQVMRRHIYASDIRSAESAIQAHRLGECIDLLQRQIPSQTDPDLRDFAWGYLWQMSHEHALELPGHSGGAYAIQFAHDGRRLLSAGNDGVIRVWDVKTGKLLQERADHESEINGLALAPGGGQMASVSDNGVVFCWSLEDSLRPLWRSDVSDSELFAVAFSPDGKRLAVAGVDRIIRLMSAEDGSVERTLVAHTEAIFGLAFWKSGRHLLSVAKDRRLLDWDLEADPILEPRMVLEDQIDGISSFCLSADGSRLAVVHKAVEVFGLPDFEPRTVIRKDADWARTIQFTNDGSQLVFGKPDSTWGIRSWTRESGDLRTFMGHAGRVIAIDVSPDDSLIATAGDDGAIRVWSRGLSKTSHRAEFDVAENSQCAFAPGGDWMLLRRRLTDDQIELTCYRADGNQWRAVDSWREPDNNRMGEVAIAENGSWVARTADRRKLLALQRDVSQSWIDIGSHPADIKQLAFVPGRAVLFSASNGLLRAWNLAEGRMAWEAAIPVGEHIQQVRASGNLVSCAVGFEVLVFDAATGRKVLHVRQPGVDLWDVVIMPDENELLACASDRTIYRWRIADGEALESWAGHDTDVERLAVHPGGQLVASADRDHKLKIWHHELGQVLLTIVQPAPTNLTFSSDGLNLHAARVHFELPSQIRTYRAGFPAEVAPDASPAPR